jgi:DNA-binding NarL/FixJ family response regulator
MTMKTSVFLIEGEPECQTMVMRLLAGSSLLDVTGVADSVAQAKPHIDRHECEVFLVNTVLPDGSGIDLMRHIQTRQPWAKILAVSTLGDEKHILGSLQAGASGYLLKAQLSNHLIESIISLINGGGYLCAHTSKVLIERLRHSLQAPASLPLSGPRPPGQAPMRTTPETTLTRKELEVLDHAKVGSPAKKIAALMGISIFTVNQHLRNIYHKLHARNRLQAIESARMQGLI